jgi:hypothetical protein
MTDPAMQSSTDPAGVPQVPQPRTQAFGQGQGDGLSQASARFNSAVPQSYNNVSVIGNPPIKSANGMAPGPTGSDRRVYGGGLLPTFLGSSDSTRNALIGMGTKRNA